MSQGDTHMKRSMWRFVVVTAAAVVVVGVLATASQAAPPNFHTPDRGPGVVRNFSNMPKPKWYVAPGLRLNQAAYNTRVIGNAYSYVPPWTYGYNPYPQVVNYGPVYPYSSGYYPYSSGYYPYSSPYGYGYPYYSPYIYP